MRRGGISKCPNGEATSAKRKSQGDIESHGVQPKEDYDPIYGYDRARQTNETMADIFSLGLSDSRGQSARARAAEELMGVELPEFSQQGFEWLGDYDPQELAMPEEARYALAQESPEGRAAMLAALQQLGEAQSSAIGSEADLARHQAVKDASQFAQGREGLIRQDAMRRGQLGGAADMIGRMQSAQMGANRAQEGGLQAAQQAALQRLAGVEAQGNLGARLRQGDQAMGFANADIINRFNMANTNARNATRLANNQAANEAQRFNIEGRQRAGDMNVGRGDDITRAMHSAATGRAQNIANAMTGQAVASGQQGDRIRDTTGSAIEYLSRLYGGGAK